MALPTGRPAPGRRIGRTDEAESDRVGWIGAVRARDMMRGRANGVFVFVFLGVCVCFSVRALSPPLSDEGGWRGRQNPTNACVCVCVSVCVFCASERARTRFRVRVRVKNEPTPWLIKKGKTETSRPPSTLFLFSLTRAPRQPTHTPTPQTCRLTSSCVDAGIYYHGKSLAGQGSLPLQAPPLPLQRACPFSFPRAHSLSPSPLDRRLRPRKVQHLAGLRGRVL